MFVAAAGTLGLFGIPHHTRSTNADAKREHHAMMQTFLFMLAAAAAAGRQQLQRE